MYNIYVPIMYDIYIYMYYTHIIYYTYITYIPYEYEFSMYMYLFIGSLQVSPPAVTLYNILGPSIMDLPTRIGHKSMQGPSWPFPYYF